LAALIACFLTIAALVLAIPVATLVVEIVAAVFVSKRAYAVRSGRGSHSRVTVLVPAHNESTALLPTLADLRTQLRTTDRLLVIADNCTDDTAAVAAAAGADVITRIDPERRGKGYALAAGLQHILNDPPDVVIIVDADCRLAEAAVDRLTSLCTTINKPVQLLYLMIAPANSPINFRVAEFAWRVKNWARPLGLYALGFPCQLMGSGMAFPWQVIHQADLANGSIVEDLQLGIDLALAGTPAVFCPYPGVTSQFPYSREGAQTQRRRWEQGHISLIPTALSLVCAAFTQRNFGLLALALDLSIPPLSLLGLLVLGMLGVSSLAALIGCSSAMFISLFNLAGLTSALFISWLNFGRDVLPSAAVPLIASYVFAKLPIYRDLFLRRASLTWTRTDRGKH
jgi:cellulose synthase/poly-beta-1,6-N-acetylglucosamine synthase-like glycosyltransferase